MVKMSPTASTAGSSPGIFFTRRILARLVLTDEQCAAFASEEQGDGGQQESDEDGGGRIECLFRCKIIPSFSAARWRILLCQYWRGGVRVFPAPPLPHPVSNKPI